MADGGHCSGPGRDAHVGRIAGARCARPSIARARAGSCLASRLPDVLWIHCDCSCFGLDCRSVRVDHALAARGAGTGADRPPRHRACSVAQRARDHRRAAPADTALGLFTRRLRCPLDRCAAAADRGCARRRRRPRPRAGAIFARNPLSAGRPRYHRRDARGGAARSRRCIVDDKLRHRTVRQALGDPRFAGARGGQPLCAGAPVRSRRRCRRAPARDLDRKRARDRSRDSRPGRLVAFYAAAARSCIGRSAGFDPLPWRTRDGADRSCVRARARCTCEPGSARRRAAPARGQGSHAGFLKSRGRYRAGAPRRDQRWLLAVGHRRSAHPDRGTLAPAGRNPDQRFRQGGVGGRGGAGRTDVDPSACRRPP